MIFLEKKFSVNFLYVKKKKNLTLFAVWNKKSQLLNDGVQTNYNGGEELCNKFQLASNVICYIILSSLLDSRYADSAYV